MVYRHSFRILEVRMAEFIKYTEQASDYRHLEDMSISEILTNINREDISVPLAVEKVLPQIEALVTVIAEQMLSGGRLFYPKV